MVRTWHLTPTTAAARSAAPPTNLVADVSAEVAGEEKELSDEVEEALVAAHKLQLRKEAYAARERELSYMTPAALAAIRAELQEGLGLVEKGHITAEKLVSAESAVDLSIGEKTYCFVKGHWLRGELYKRHPDTRSLVYLHFSRMKMRQITTTTTKTARMIMILDRVL